MYKLNLPDINITYDRKAGHIKSLTLNGKELVHAFTPLFRIRLRDKKGDFLIIDTYDHIKYKNHDQGATYIGFNSKNRSFDLSKLSVSVDLTEKNNEAVWSISVDPNNKNICVEWVDFPLVCLPMLEDNNHEGTGGKILLPYNEGVIISDVTQGERNRFGYSEPEYPSRGNYYIFPNMMSSQLLAYLWSDSGLYIGAHDKNRGVKEFAFYTHENGTVLKLRSFSGKDHGQKYKTDFAIVFSKIDGRWESAAERYRKWFESELPLNLKKISDNPALPEWYKDSPLVVSYPVRGKHDMDDMTPNALFPYVKALPVLNDIKKQTNSRLLVLLMHWEGTAPWAPPYVWPPYSDDIDQFDDFLEKIHKNGDMLGVYCSGFGYTIQSNLISDYNCNNEYINENLSSAMCASPNGTVSISQICTAQRSGYDICPASEKGKELLSKAYDPLFSSGLDYVQILDQNHGGGQYFCYSQEHGHPYVPGAWMTNNMQKLLSDWNKKAPNMLFGCESAAAEPFIPNLLFSDNRFELNYRTGTAVPLYAYIYHEYVRNFMGNQVSCPFSLEDDTLCYRLAYSFSAGDCMTIVLSPEGDIMSYWGMKDFSKKTNKEKILKFIFNLTQFYKNEAFQFLYDGRMIPALPIICDKISFRYRTSEQKITLPALLSTAWESKNKKRIQIIINPQETEKTCIINQKTITIPPLNAVSISL